MDAYDDDDDDDESVLSEGQSDNELAEESAPDEDVLLAAATFSRTGFDQYFTLNSKTSKTSSNVFSDKIPPLDSQEYREATRASSTRSLLVPWLQTGRGQLFRRFTTQLEEGFNLLMYGAGSKREVLNALAMHISGRRRDVCVVNGSNPNCSLKDLLSAIESIPALQAYPSTSGSGVEAQTRRIHRFFSSNDSDKHVYLVIHNIDAPSLRHPKSQAALSLLASCPRIHIVASADNIAFPHLWSFTDIFSRKSALSARADGTSSGGFAWLFHDLTTLAPYDFELAYADRSSIKSASQARLSRSQKDAPGATATALMSESAARHVLASVTEKAKKLFVLLGTKQLELMEETNAATMDPQQLAFSYSALFNMAREDFIATNDTALRALMGEFKDHGLIVSVQGGGGNEAVWIPLRKDALLKVVRDLKQE
ncbi:hypothetical protein NM688_g314 [Phlebia brevispora]|uniref:Uncharacterized protein n=1 Tax=Phlebia brevispora TaxID=194682 RepID=A0ACC1TEV4_9APHY|nr:hypothetical protein NM688_g314 [Phlebia brevispora]